MAWSEKCEHRIGSPKIAQHQVSFPNQAINVWWLYVKARAKCCSFFSKFFSSIPSSIFCFLDCLLKNVWGAVRCSNIPEGSLSPKSGQYFLMIVHKNKGEMLVVFLQNVSLPIRSSNSCFFLELLCWKDVWDPVRCSNSSEGSFFPKSGHYCLMIVCKNKGEMLLVFLQVFFLPFDLPSNKFVPF